jgi:hypothetical protein
MSDVLPYLPGALFLMVFLPIMADEIRHQYFPSQWACSKCGQGPLEANGPESMFDGRKGFHCSKCNHVMQAYRSRLVLSLCIVLAVATTVACAVILYLDMNPDKMKMTSRPVYWLIYTAVVLGPCLTAYGAYLMQQPMPTKHLNESSLSSRRG